MVKLYTISTYEERDLIVNERPLFCVKKQEYDEETYMKIKKEKEEWCLQVYITYGCDYGYGNCDETIYKDYSEIDDETIVVEDGHFVGVCISSEGYSFNKRYTNYDEMKTTFIQNYQGKPLEVARRGTSFSSDDHEKWDLTYYYLMKKCDK